MNQNTPIIPCLEVLMKTGLTEEQAIRSAQVIDDWIRKHYPLAYALFRNMQENKREEYDPIDISGHPERNESSFS